MSNASETIPMDSTAFRALTDACDHTRLALAAARCCEPFCSRSMVLLDAVRQSFAAHLKGLEQLKRAARVTE